jgi:hypothetical protein
LAWISDLVSRLTPTVCVCLSVCRSHHGKDGWSRMKESVRQKENVSATKKARTTKEEGGAGYERESRFDTEEVKESTTGSCVPFEVQTESKYLLGTQTTDGWIPVSSSLKSKPLVFHPSSVPNSPTVTHNHSLTSDPKVLFLVSHFVLSFSRNNAQAVRKIKIDK